ncbi:hypothetical protein D9613_010468 [Agrocybe pediades]|uniref:Glycosyl transferase CAP10 domain-containing protein n=1 Tax=Agrocybe pediades TaxID=84607 RepID=A0A8H4VI23_9AGAR|nr:hypothetical protein D9613_010468 [Agrocybe pediades]
MLGVSSRRSSRARRPLAIIFLIGCIFVLGFKGPEYIPTDPLKSGKILRTFDNITEGRRLTRDNVRQEASEAACDAPDLGLRYEELEAHVYKSNGLLYNNPNGEHPIYELVRRAQEQWDLKLKSASKTFEEAVAEYQRRYRRLPPPGFDAWWKYVQEHNVQLPDEYDQIYRDLQPFWGMDPTDLQAIQREWEAHADSFTVGKDTIDEPISLKNFSLPDDDISPNGLAKGAYDIMKLLKEVEGSIPPFRAIFSPHDNPNLATDFELRKQALQAAEAGTYIDVNKPPKVKLDGWISACPPNSPAQLQRINWGGAPRLPSRSMRSKTFIHDHRASMDPCLHPSVFLTHGQFVSHGAGPIPHRKLIPQFSFGPTLVHHDITPALPINWIEDIHPKSDNPEWDDRVDSRMYWRGRNTGIWHADDKRWDLAQRERLVSWGGDGESMTPDSGRDMTVLMPTAEGKRVGLGMSVSKAQWRPAMVDVAFAGDPVNCPPDMCGRLGEIFEFRKYQGQSFARKYKYYIDVDGNGWSSRFKRLITSNAVVFKSTIYPEWYLDRVAPWVHYVPIKVDLSDLWDAFTFFRGDPLGNGAHEDMAKKIAEEGRKWSKTFWRREDMTAYMFRLFLEYARVMDPERKSMEVDPSKIILKESHRGPLNRPTFFVENDEDEEGY